MSKFKNERDWSDFGRDDKIMIFVMVVLWALIETGVFFENKRAINNAQKNMIKTEMVRVR